MSNKCDGSGMMSLHHAVNYVANGNGIKNSFPLNIICMSHKLQPYIKLYLHAVYNEVI